MVQAVEPMPHQDGVHGRRRQSNDAGDPGWTEPTPSAETNDAALGGDLGPGW
jgi:hypothetical protein